MLGNARRAYRRLTMAPLPPEGTLTYASSVEEAVDGADLIQESAPERLELKQRLLADASRAAGADAIVCSSTSGLLPSLLQSQMLGAARFVVGHPFNPVYLLPLVELCGGDATAPETVARAAAAYEAVGMRPVIVATEIDGFIADRLLEALWREALWLVHDDIATVEEIDDAIRYGAGLRWAIMGTFLTYRIAGGKDGMRHFVEQFGPTLSAPWSKLVDVPELSGEFVEKLAAQSDAQAHGQTISQLEQQRDDCLVTLLQGLRAHEHRRRRDPGRLGARPRPPRRAASALQRRRHRGAARAVRERGRARVDRLQRPRHREPLPGAVRAGDRRAAAAHRPRRRLPRGDGLVLHRRDAHLPPRELFAGDRVRVTTQLLGCDSKRLHFFHVLLRDGEQDPIATGEHMLLHVDAATGRAGPARGDVAARAAALVAAHARLPRPERAGRRIEAARPTAR